MTWDIPALGQPPQTHPAPDFAADGVEALYYSGPPWQGRETRAFAWLGVPEGTEACPAMVLVHGGGGTAFAEWVRMWNARGYAAIAMDLCGCLPPPENAHAPAQHRRSPCGGPPGWGASFEQIDQEVADQWPYHAIANIMLARSLLAAHPRVDAQRIGLTGISWGGYLTSLIVGVDARFRLAVPVYGCGFLDRQTAFTPMLQALGASRMQRWLELWDPSAHLHRAKMPVLWVTGTNDFAYPMNALRLSYSMPTGERTLCIRVRMAHGHPPGWAPAEIEEFANSHLRGGTPLARVGKPALEAGQLRAEVDSACPLQAAALAYTCDADAWAQRQWHETPAELDAANATVAAGLPANVTACYLNVTDQRDRLVSSEHLEVEAGRVRD